MCGASPWPAASAIFKQLFARGQEFTYGIEDIARYYRSYLELMRHWDAVLPGRVLRVQYEDLVEDLEGTVVACSSHCGLAFEPACLEFHTQCAQRRHGQRASRCASRCIARRSGTGATTSRGSARCAPRSVMHLTRYRD